MKKAFNGFIGRPDRAGVGGVKISELEVRLTEIIPTETQTEIKFEKGWEKYITFFYAIFCVF